ncbi:MAG: hypothetical protein WBW78_08780 [Terrimicrobiaceae bacterium]
MKTKQLPNDFRDWIGSRTFPIGVQEAVEPRLHTNARGDVGDGNELESTAARPQGHVAPPAVVSVIFIFQGRLTRPMCSFGSKRPTDCRLDASPPSEAAIY